MSFATYVAYKPIDEAQSWSQTFYIEHPEGAAINIGEPWHATPASCTQSSLPLPPSPSPRHVRVLHSASLPLPPPPLLVHAMSASCIAGGLANVPTIIKSRNGAILRSFANQEILTSLSAADWLSFAGVSLSDRQEVSPLFVHGDAAAWPRLPVAGTGSHWHRDSA